MWINVNILLFDSKMIAAFVYDYRPVTYNEGVWTSYKLYWKKKQNKKTDLEPTMKWDLKTISPSAVAHRLQALGRQAQICCSLEPTHRAFFGCKFKCRFLAASRRQREKKPMFLVLLRAGPTQRQYNQQGKTIHGWWYLKPCSTLSQLT